MSKPAVLMLLSLYLLTLSSSPLGQVPAETKSVGMKTGKSRRPQNVKTLQSYGGI